MCNKYVPVLDSKDKLLDSIKEINPSIYKALQEGDGSISVFHIKTRSVETLEIVKTGVGHLCWKCEIYRLRVKKSQLGTFINLDDLKSYCLAGPKKYSIGTYDQKMYIVCSSEIYHEDNIYLTDVVGINNVSNVSLAAKAKDSRPVYSIGNFFEGFKNVVSNSTKYVSTGGVQTVNHSIKILNFSQIEATKENDDEIKLWHRTDYLYSGKAPVVPLDDFYLSMDKSPATTYTSGQIVHSDQDGSMVVKGILYTIKKEYSKKILIDFGNFQRIYNEENLDIIKYYKQFEKVVTVAQENNNLQISTHNLSEIEFVIKNKTLMISTIYGKLPDSFVWPNKFYLLMKVSTVSNFVYGQNVRSAKYGTSIVKGVLFNPAKEYSKQILIGIQEILLTVNEDDLTIL